MEKHRRAVFEIFPRSPRSEEEYTDFMNRLWSAWVREKKKNAVRKVSEVCRRPQENYSAAVSTPAARSSNPSSTNNVPNHLATPLSPPLPAFTEGQSPLLPPLQIATPRSRRRVSSAVIATPSKILSDTSSTSSLTPRKRSIDDSVHGDTSHGLPTSSAIIQNVLASNLADYLRKGLLSRQAVLDVLDEFAMEEYLHSDRSLSHLNHLPRLLSPPFTQDSPDIPPKPDSNANNSAQEEAIEDIQSTAPPFARDRFSTRETIDPSVIELSPTTPAPLSPVESMGDDEGNGQFPGDPQYPPQSRSELQKDKKSPEVPQYPSDPEEEDFPSEEEDLPSEEEDFEGEEEEHEATTESAPPKQPTPSTQTLEEFVRNIPIDQEINEITDDTELNQDLLQPNEIQPERQDLWLEPSEINPDCYVVDPNARGEIPRATPPLDGDLTSADTEAEVNAGPESTPKLSQLFTSDITLRQL